MILVGRNLSPYTRRVAVSLDLMEMPFERHELATATEVEAIKGYNPLGRVPALKLPDGEVLIESSAILDHLDEMAGPGLRLTPASGPARRAVMRLCAYATGAMDKAVLGYSRKPAGRKTCAGPNTPRAWTRRFAPDFRSLRRPPPPPPSGWWAITSPRPT